MTDRAPELVETLRAARTRYGGRARAAKVDLLERLSALPIDTAGAMKSCWSTLHFLEAYPDDATVHRLAVACIKRLAGECARRRGRGLLNSGLPGTVVEATLTLDAAAWLLDRHPHGVDIAWDDDSAGTELDELLEVCVEPVERDGLLDGRLSTREWFALARGDDDTPDLAWLVQRLRILQAPPEVRDRLFEGLDLQIRWTLEEDAPPRFPARRLFHHGDLRRDVVLPDLVRRDLPEVRPCPAAEGAALIECSRRTLYSRQRETDPITYADPGDVTLVRLDRGIDVALFGMTPDRRLPLDSFIGYMAARNRVPVAYGGGWIFFDRSEIGINVFDEFRGGESAFLFGQILRVYHRHLGVQRFLVDPFQFGADNTEGIRSGAFWFYYRLGFRPVEPKLAALAADEWSQVQTDRTRRTKPSILRRLTGAKLGLDLGDGAAAPDPLRLGLAVTRRIGAGFGGDRDASRRWALRRLARLLPATGSAHWPAPERAAYERFAPLMALIKDLKAWSAADKRALVALMRAKGGTHERDFVVKTHRHNRLRAALDRLAHDSSDK